MQKCVQISLGATIRADFATTPALLRNGQKLGTALLIRWRQCGKIPTLPTRRRGLLLAGKRHRKSRKPQNEEPRRGGGTHAGEKRGAAAAGPQSRTWPLPRPAQPADDRADMAARHGSTRLRCRRAMRYSAYKPLRNKLLVSAVGHSTQKSAFPAVSSAHPLDQNATTVKIVH